MRTQRGSLHLSLLAGRPRNPSINLIKCSRAISHDGIIPKEWRQGHCEARQPGLCIGAWGVSRESDSGIDSSLIIFQQYLLISNIQNIMLKRDSKASSMPKFGRTASTMINTQTSSLFRKPRNDKRLNSTIRIDPNTHLNSRTTITWNKWKKNDFQIPNDNFRKVLTNKLEKEAERREPLQISDSELKLRHKIRQLMKMKGDIEKARENSRLIKLIENYHENKINGFFEQLESYLHKK